MTTAQEFDQTRWRDASTMLIAAAGIADFRLDNGTPEGAVPPLHLAGGFARATAVVAQRCETVLVRVGRNHGAELSEEALDAMRAAVRHLHAARVALGEVVPALDPDDRGIN